MILFSALFFVPLVQGVEPDLKTFRSKVEPVLKQYCYECHGPDGEASPRMTLLDPDLYFPHPHPMYTRKCRLLDLDLYFAHLASPIH